ncbi:MAG: zinc-ribbon domain-containing transport protein [Bacteroidetes bacterium]|nr:zinc-ribbon domain-containing transport protein [Bacteroidota bacterium]
MKVQYYFYRVILLLVSLGLSTAELYARAGGGGGRSRGGGGGGYHSSSSYHGYHSYGGGSGGGGSLTGGEIVLVLVIIGIVVIFNYYKNKGGKEAGKQDYVAPSTPAANFPEGLTPQKVESSFRTIQDAWQNKNLKDARKWISDGVYQRYTAQFAMMNKLSQVNKLSNIQVRGLRLAKVNTDGHYQTADVAISFRMDDRFISDRYPQFNESFEGDEATEYWTFIRRTDTNANKDLYSTANCPNCGAPFETQMGEISRCSGCGTLTNSGAYDWVLSEITQEDDYSPHNSMVKDQQLAALTKNDSLFAVQRVEDVASNVFMQIMEVLTGDKDKKLSRFADADTAASILAVKKQSGGFIFDRLYLNDVSLVNYDTEGERLNLHFDLTATYQRVRANGAKLELMDGDMTEHRFSMTLSKNLKALQTPEKETVYSYECPSCGAPYNDTTDDVCTYCGAPVIDLNKNWVLTGFNMG